jgi:hypothetical protein
VESNPCGWGMMAEFLGLARDRMFDVTLIIVFPEITTTHQVMNNLAINGTEKLDFGEYNKIS